MSIAANIRQHRTETQLASLLLEISGLTSRVKLLEDALRSPQGIVVEAAPALPEAPAEVESAAVSPRPAAKSKAGQGFPSRKAKRAATQGAQASRAQGGS